MTRNIKYSPKITGAKTEYRELRPEDQAWLIAELNKWMVKMGVLSNTTNEDFRELRDSYWRKRRSSLPRGRDGNNSPESMIAGILDNILYAENPQRDFTAKQCEAIEDISKWMNAVDAALEEVRFQIGVV